MAYTKDSVRRFMTKQNFSISDVLYILRKDKQTWIHLLDGRAPSCKIPLGHFQDFFPDGHFSRINKDALIQVNQVVKVNKGHYLMIDGAILEGRHHGTKTHTDFVRRLMAEQKEKNSSEQMFKLREKFSVYDDLPLPFCVIQLVFDTHGKGTTFIFRYCNKLMEDLEGVPVQKLLNHSFHDIFEDGDEKWLIRYGDVARNGGYRVFREYSPEIDKHLTVLCHQVMPDFCACTLIEDGWLDRMVSLSEKNIFL